MSTMAAHRPLADDPDHCEPDCPACAELIEREEREERALDDSDWCFGSLASDTAPAVASDRKLRERIRQIERFLDARFPGWDGRRR